MDFEVSSHSTRGDRGVNMLRTFSLLAADACFFPSCLCVPALYLLFNVLVMLAAAGAKKVRRRRWSVAAARSIDSIYCLRHGTFTKIDRVSLNKNREMSA